MIDLKVHKGTTLDGFGEGNIETFAKKQQLLLANDLGLKAVDLTSDVIFKAKSYVKVE